MDAVIAAALPSVREAAQDQVSGIPAACQVARASHAPDGMGDLIAFERRCARECRRGRKAPLSFDRD